MRAQSIVGHGNDRSPFDFYATPPECVAELIGLETLYGPIWEPACGDGAISEVLSASGFDVISTDLIDRGYGESGRDFLLEPIDRKVPTIVTNPPYRLAQEFVERSLLIAEYKVIMLLKLTFLEGQARREFFKRTPLKKIWVYSRRIRFDNPNGKQYKSGMLAYAWYVWEIGYTGDPTIGWI